MKKTTRFKQMLQSKQLEFICEAHNGLSAKIVEEAGFRGIWGSGLSISAAMGVRDNNEASWTQVLEVLEFMSDNTSVPILLDGDTGYGNFNNMRRLVSKLEQRGVAAVCIEDKIFPKTNSFIKGESQPLAEIEEFCGKIKAGKDAQSDSDFSIVARTEAFIAGWGLEEALKRANAYYEAGADAILVHSKIAKPDDIINFMGEWGDRCPIVIVPTMYYDTPTTVWRELGISLVIWANHILRSGIRAMQDTAAHLMEHESLLHIEKKLPTVKEIFRLQGMEEYQQWEKAYLPKKRQGGRGILLAASKGNGFGRLTDDKPKAMIEVEGQPIILGSVNALRKSDIRDITIVTGYKPEAFNLGTVKYVQNEGWEQTGEVGSLLAARDKIAGEGELVVGYGDVVARSFVLKNLVESTAPLTVVVDYQAPHHKTRTSIDWARVTPERVEGIKKIDYKLVKVDPQIEPAAAQGEWIGLLACTGEGSKILAKTLDELVAADVNVANWSMPQLLSHMVESGVEVAVQYIHDNWLDIDDIADLSDLYKF
ncbi:MAG: phosphoenolpyruvate mutase [Deltaproteobacteria bacterium]|nr:MAG: phosphoenolpyruvate mutase [Deltaproteobacteria bacterium]